MPETCRSLRPGMPKRARTVLRPGMPKRARTVLCHLDAANDLAVPDLGAEHL